MTTPAGQTPRSREGKGPLVWLDLCSGLGGASQPALDRDWKVIRVDIDPKFAPDLLLDVTDPDAPRLIREHLRYAGVERPDVLWASPPCTDFAKWGLRCFFPNPPKPDMAVVCAVKRLIDLFDPPHWCVENVVSSRPFITPIFGQVRALTTGHSLWSNLGFLLPNIKPQKGAIRTGRIYKGKKPGWGPMNHDKSRRDSHERAAKIPYEIGEAICAAVERRAAEQGGD